MQHNYDSLDSILVDYIDEQFIELRSTDAIVLDLKYSQMPLKYAVNKCFVREQVYNKLLHISHNLPGRYKLKIFDAWRPFALQKELFSFYSQSIIQQFNLYGKSSEEQTHVIQQYVSIPNQNPPPVHTTGGAVDVTIIDKSGKELNMGTIFDEFSLLTHTSYFDDKSDETAKEISRNRKILQDLMAEEGFVNLPSEWWHYDFGDRIWAYYCHTSALYNGLYTLEEVYEKEKKLKLNS